MSITVSVNKSNKLVDRISVAHEKTAHALRKMDEVLIGQPEVTKLTLAGLLAGTHILFTGGVGLGKTTLSSRLAELFSLESSRIQGTPDITPMDITGLDIYDEKTKKWEFQKGPIISQVVLFDEINRTPPRTHAALLQAMQEKEVTSGNTTHKLGPPFHVLATRNPIEQGGTYPLPEALLDRFSLDIPLINPPEEDEVNIVAAIINEDDYERFDPVMSREEFLDTQKLVNRVAQDTLTTNFHTNAVKLVRQFRPHEEGAHEAVNEKMVQGPNGPRAMGTFLRVASALAVIENTFTPNTEHLARLARPVIGHRSLLSSQARVASGAERRKVLGRLINEVTAETLSM